MKNILLLGAMLLAGLFVQSCKPEAPEPDSTFQLNFNRTASGQSYALGQETHDAKGRHYQIDMMQFYVSNLELVKEDGTAERLADILLVNMDQDLASPNPATINNRFTYNSNTRTGSYKGIRFGLGVASEYNSEKNPNFDATVYPNDHPLSITRGTYWAWSSGYRFVSIEGKTDTTAGQNGPLNRALSYHTGLDTFYRVIEISQPMQFTAGQTTTLDINVDIHKIFDNGANTIDLRNELQTHTMPMAPKEMDISRRITENMTGVLRK